jgi:hypothetical protein
MMVIMAGGCVILTNKLASAKIIKLVVGIGLSKNKRKEKK